MTGTTPAALRSDAWVIRQNALRLLGALRAIVDRFGTAAEANLVRRVIARVETSISADAVGLAAIDGVGQTRASSLASAGYQTPEDVARATVDELAAAGLSDGVARQVTESAAELPVVEVDWGAFPDSIGRDERDLCEITVRSSAGDARAGLWVTVNGIEMTRKSTYLGETTLPIGVFGGDAEELTYTVHVAFPDLPLSPITHTRTVGVRDS
jgi:hypothetical protein